MTLVRFIAAAVLAFGFGPLVSLSAEATEAAPRQSSVPSASGATNAPADPKDGSGSDAETAPPAPPPVRYDPGVHGPKDRSVGTRHESNRRNGGFGAPSHLRGLGGLPEGR